MKGYKIGYLNKSKKTLSGKGVEGPPGPTGPAGAGFQLSASGDFDLQAKKLTNVAMGSANDDVVTKQQLNSKVDKVMTGHLDANFKEIKNVSRGTDDDAFPLFHGKSIFLTTNGSKFDAKSQQITNLVTNTADNTSAVNVAAMNRALSNSSSSQGSITKNIDLTNSFNVLNSKQRTLNELKTHYDSLVSFEEVNENFLSRVEEFPMKTQFNMNHNSITNLKDPVFDHEAATKGYADKKLPLTGGRMSGAINMGTFGITNLATPTGNASAATKKYVDDVDSNVRTDMSKEVVQIQNLLDARLEKAGGTMSGAIDMGTSKITNLGTPTDQADAATKDFVEKSHVSQSGLQQNLFLFQMLSVNESSSETGNIRVAGILKFTNSPHTLFKTAYNFTIGKNNFNEYNARIGFNFNPVPTGTYTYVVEYFPPTMTNVSVDCLSSALSVNKQIFKKFSTYVKNIVQIHKWTAAKPDYLMVDIKSDGDASSPAQGEGWMIVYGIEGTHSDVPSSILDTSFVVKNGDFVFQTDVSMGGRYIKNLPMPVGDYQAASKQYVDTAGIYSILSLATATYVDGYIKENAECMYSVERGTKEEVVFNSSSRQISALFDQTLSGLNSSQSTTALQPKLSTTKNSKRFFFEFDGSKRMLSNIDLNPPSGGQDLVHVFILFRLSTHAGSNANFRNGLFGHDNGGWDKFVSFAANTNNLIIAGTQKDGSESNGGFNIQVTSSHWLAKANASELNKWCCLSVHWDVPAGAGNSSCWVNGKKVKTFEARTSAGSNQMTFGDLDPSGIAGLNGDIQLFILYKGYGMAELIIKAHHKMICERYGVDHDEISFP